eukprot:TRINITY_DN601_c0_g1_i1.p1 TRINITY_DN601_c0_g1~~TRINITY_DN601_c0_g1_i1.p1  ORF type:complete len:382 (-),score=83.29 TRINITY_DN601_c0_g1_i1:51-1067(-)
MGAAIAHLHIQETFKPASFILGLLIVSTTHVMTHFFNEYYDLLADEYNTNPSPWTGGSRMLVQKKLEPRYSLFLGRLLFTMLAVFAAGFAWFGNSAAAAVILLEATFGHQYSAKPLQTSRIGLGEATVWLVLHILTPLMGFAVQTGSLSMPISFWIAMVPVCAVEQIRMMVMNMADVDSDRKADKRTLVVRIGLENSKVWFRVGFALAFITVAYNALFGLVPVVMSMLMTLPLIPGVYVLHLLNCVEWDFYLPFWASQFNAIMMIAAYLGFLVTGKESGSVTDGDLLLYIPAFLAIPVSAMSIYSTLKKQTSTAVVEAPLKEEQETTDDQPLKRMKME